MGEVDFVRAFLANFNAAAADLPPAANARCQDLVSHDLFQPPQTRHPQSTFLSAQALPGARARKSVLHVKPLKAQTANLKSTYTFTDIDIHSMTLEQFKAKLSKEITDIGFKVVLKGKVLFGDTKPLESLGVVDGSVIHLMLSPSAAPASPPEFGTSAAEQTKSPAQNLFDSHPFWAKLDEFLASSTMPTQLTQQQRHQLVDSVKSQVRSLPSNPRSS